MTVRDLPALDAALNATAAVLLLAGWRAIRRKDRDRHRALMLSALAVSAVFLGCYLAYHWQVGSVRYQRQGWPRVLYLSVLLTHTVGAVVSTPLVLRAAWLAWRGDFERHARLARWAFPLWLYVSVTGVVVWLALYVLK